MESSKFNPIVRHRTSRASQLLRGTILVALWLFVCLVVFANLSFRLGWYNDDLVSLYLLLNLNLHGDNHILDLIGILLLIVPAYCGWRWWRLSKGGRS